MKVFLTIHRTTTAEVNMITLSYVHENMLDNVNGHHHRQSNDHFNIGSKWNFRQSAWPPPTKVFSYFYIFLSNVGACVWTLPVSVRVCVCGSMYVFEYVCVCVRLNAHKLLYSCVLDFVCLCVYTHVAVRVSAFVCAYVVCVMSYVPWYSANTQTDRQTGQ